MIWIAAKLEMSNNLGEWHQAQAENLDDLSEGRFNVVELLQAPERAKIEQQRQTDIEPSEIAVTSGKALTLIADSTRHVALSQLIKRNWVCYNELRIMGFQKNKNDVPRKLRYELSPAPGKEWIECFFTHWNEVAEGLLPKAEVRFSGNALIVISLNFSVFAYHPAILESARKTNHEQEQQLKLELL